MASSAVQIQTGTNDLAYTGRLPLFETGNYVYQRTDYTVGTGTNAPYKLKPFKVVAVGWKSNGAGVLLDSTGASAVGANAANLSTTDEDITPDTNATWPWRYLCEDVSNQNKWVLIAESTLKSIAGVRARVDADNNTAWVNPS